MSIGNDERSKKFSKKSDNHPPLVVAEMLSVRTNKLTMCNFLSTMNEDLLAVSNGKTFKSICFFLQYIIYIFFYILNFRITNDVQQELYTNNIIFKLLKFSLRHVNYFCDLSFFIQKALKIAIIIN